MARPRTGTLVWRSGRWHGRVSLPGSRERPLVDLETTDEVVARRKLVRLVADTEGGRIPPEVARALRGPETFATAAVAILAEQRRTGGREGTGLRRPGERKHRVETFALPVLGPMPVRDIRAPHITRALERVRDAGLSHRTIVHLRNDLSSIFRRLVATGTLEHNPVTDAEVPRGGKRETRARAVLTDEELARYLTYRLPEELSRSFPAAEYGLRERQTMVALCRMFGGVRTGDLLALQWDDFDRPTFERGWAPRKKTSTPQRLIVPELLRPILREWWTEQGEPSEGPLFPSRSGRSEGEARTWVVSFAAALRSDLRRAFGLDVWRLVPTSRKDGRQCQRHRWIDVTELPAEDPAHRAMTERERQLFSGDRYTQRIDFHSGRRAYVQALAAAEVTAQQAQALSGHADLATHLSYARNPSQGAEMPAGALPRHPFLRVVQSSQPDRTEPAETTGGKRIAEPIVTGRVTGTR